MQDVSPEHYRNKSITHLVEELNQLGDQQVAMHHTTLLAVHEEDTTDVRRFRSKSNHSKPNNTPITQFFLTDASQKKYYYADIVNELEVVLLGNIMKHYQKGFNVSVALQANPGRLAQLISQMCPWFCESQDSSRMYINFMEYRVRDFVDLLAPKQIGENAYAFSSLPERQNTFYQITLKELEPVLKTESKHIRIMKIRSCSRQQPEVRLLLLPAEFLITRPSDPNLRAIKNQLLQILNYIKTNPKKRYENFNKFFPKRHPVTACLAQLLFYDSANFVINWVNDKRSENGLINGRFDFYDKLALISNFLRRVDEPPISIAPRKKQCKKKEDLKEETKRSTKQSFSKQNELQNTACGMEKKEKERQFEPNPISELQYCRSLERKTHKYSLSEGQSSNDLFNHEEQNYYPPNQQYHSHCNEAEAIAILKCQHAREISQYHQTIQNLNKKILVLTSQKGLQELYTIHQREIMLLELKVSELRDEINKLCNVKGKKNSEDQLKETIKKLNTQIQEFEKNNKSGKVWQGKIKMLQKQNTELKNKNQKSQLARGELVQQLQSMRKRLKLKEQQILQFQTTEQPQTQLSSNDHQIFNEIQQVIQKLVINQTGKRHLLQKISRILGQLSGSRELILDCNSFLVELQEHLESRLGQKDPQVVLDCNRFIRGFLMENLSIF